ncbi:MAG: radical SAM protein [Pseudomonadota bacterium]
MHLSVAPRCNIRCNYCNRLHDCPNEGRPGVTSRVLDPDGAMRYLAMAVAAGPVSVAGIAGPGDPLANPGNTFTTLRMVRERYPRMLRCLSTNGLAAPALMEEIVELATHVTITVNAVDERVGAGLYAWVNAGGTVRRAQSGAALLRDSQMEAIRLLKEAGVTVKVNCVVVPGVNDTHVSDVARAVAGLGADLFNAMPLAPVKGTLFEDYPEPGRAEMREIRQEAARHLPQMTHCARCRADAAGLIGAAAAEGRAATRGRRFTRLTCAS